jgi:Fe(3+) dicitrate transport protein
LLKTNFIFTSRIFSSDEVSMSFKRFTHAAVLLLILSASLLAQDKLKITGRVLDTNSAAIADAEVLLIRRDVRFVRQTVTDANGNFEFSGLSEGDYRITTTAKSFGSSTRSLRISASENSSVDFTLQPAQVAAEVSVASSYLAGTTESLSEIPGSIERINPQTLENSRVFNFSEALRKVSGVNVRDEEGFGLRPNIGIRGTNPTRSTKVLLLEDGLPLTYAPYGDNASYYHPPVERYESIEVLKGSGQIVYGPQTLAGVVNYITPNPPSKPTLNLKLEGGTLRFLNGSAGFGGTWGEKLGFITNFTHKRGEGSRDNIFSKLYDTASKLTYQINERNALTGKFTFYREDSNIAYTGLTEAEYAQSQRGNIFRNDFFYGRRYGISLQHVAILTSKISLTTNFYSNYFSRDWWRQSSNSNERPNRLGSDSDCRGLQDLYTTCGNQGRLRNYLMTGLETRLNADFNWGAVRNELNAGFRVHGEKQKRRQENGDLPNSRRGTLAEFNIRKNLAYSGFAQYRFIFRDFAVTPGVRVERIEFERENRLTTATFSGSIGKTNLTQVIPGIGVAYSGLKNTTIFAGAHRGFAPPRTEDIISNTGGVVELDPELSWNYELGIRTRPFRGVSLESAFFRNDYENQIVAASIAGGIGSAFTNGGATLQQGFEFSGQLDTGTIFDSPHNFYFRAAYTFLPVAEFRGERYSSITNNSQLLALCQPERLQILSAASSRCLVTGNRLPYTPKHTLTSSFGYSHPVGVDAFLENVYVGRQFADDINTIRSLPNGQVGTIGEQIYWNATANYKVERWKTTFFVTAKNIFDRTFVVDRSRGLLPGIPRLVQGGVKIIF